MLDTFSWYVLAKRLQLSLKSVTHSVIPIHEASDSGIRFVFTCYKLGRFTLICSKVLSAGAEGHLGEERLGLPLARQSQLQPIPGDTPQGTAEPLRQSDGTSVETGLRQGREDQTGRSRKNRKGEKQQREQHSQRRRTCSVCQSRKCPAAWVQVWSKYQLVYLEVQIPTHRIVN